MILTLDTLQAAGQFSSAGGYIDTNNVEWVVTGLDGWLGTPAPAPKRTVRATAPGVNRGAAYKGVRTIVLGVTATQINQASAPMRTAERMVAGLCNDPALLYPLVVEDHLGRLMAYVELDGEILPALRDGMDWSTLWSIPLSAPDPRRFAVEWTAVTAPASVGSSGGIDSTGNGVDSTGLGVDSGTDVTAPQATAAAKGTATNGLVFAITGPTTNATVTESTSGIQVGYSGALGPADTVYINCDNQPAYDVPGAGGPIPARGVLLGGSNARSALSVLGGWPSLPKGGSNTYLLGGTYSLGAGLVVYTREAYA